MKEIERKNDLILDRQVSWESNHNPLLLLYYESKKIECLATEKSNWVESIYLLKNYEFYTGCVTVKDGKQYLHGWGVLESIKPLKNWPRTTDYFNFNFV